MRLAGSPVAHAWPPTLGHRPGGIPWDWLRGDNRLDKDLSETKDQGPRTKDKATKDQGLYHNNRFLGDHIPGGGIDLRASGCAPCVLAAYPAV
jgi:hypothetical protein